MPTGPYRDKSAYDTVIQAYAGLASNQADPADGVPVFLRQTAADKVTSLYASQAITAALFARARGNGGQHVELSMMDAVVSFLWADSAANEVLLASDHTQHSSFVAGFRPFRFTDGWGIVTPTSDADFAGMCKAFDVEGYDDPRVSSIRERIKHRHLTEAIMNSCYATAANLTSDEAMARLNAERVPCSLVIAPADLPNDEHAAAVGLFVERDHPVVGPTRIPRHPTRFSAGPAELGGAGTPAGRAHRRGPGRARSGRTHRRAAGQGRGRMSQDHLVHGVDTARCRRWVAPSEPDYLSLSAQVAATPGGNGTANAFRVKDTRV